MRTSLCRPAGCSSIWLLRRTARYSSSLRVVAINDVYELHALPRLKSLINERKPQIVSLVWRRPPPHQRDDLRLALIDQRLEPRQRVKLVDVVDCDDAQARGVAGGASQQPDGRAAGRSAQGRAHCPSGVHHKKCFSTRPC